MRRNHSNRLAVLALYLVGAAFVARADVTASPNRDIAVGLADAACDLDEAEQALRRNPEAAASFAALLRDARVRLEAGIEAAAGVPTCAQSTSSNVCRRAHRAARGARLIGVREQSGRHARCRRGQEIGAGN